MSSRFEVDRLCNRIKANQYGAITRRQLVDAGLSLPAIDYRVRSGKLTPARPGVYVDPGSPATRERDIIVATLWAGEGSAASHVTGAGLLGLTDHPALVDVTTTRPLRRQQGIRLHRTTTLDPTDIEFVQSIPVTNAARTIMDLSSVLTETALEIVLDAALRERLVDITALRAHLMDLGRRGRLGAGSLWRLLEIRGDDQPPTESALETLVARAVRHGLMPSPVRQHSVYDEDGLVGRLDFAYPWALAALEADSFRFHTGRRDWERELRKRNRLMRLGWRIRHVTYADATKNHRMVIADARALLQGCAIDVE